MRGINILPNCEKKPKLFCSCTKKLDRVDCLSIGVRRNTPQVADGCLYSVQLHGHRRHHHHHHHQFIITRQWTVAQGILPLLPVCVCLHLYTVAPSPWSCPMRCGGGPAGWDRDSPSSSTTDSELGAWGLRFDLVTGRQIKSGQKWLYIKNNLPLGYIGLFK